jgi:hypothetical protein
MDENEVTTEEKELQDALLLVPEEVQDFMWSDAFQFILDTAEKVILLSKEERASMQRAAYNLLLQMTNMEKVAAEMTSEGIDKEKVVKMLYVIENEILIGSKNIMSEAEEENAAITEAPEQSSALKAPSPVEALAMIKDRLSKPNTITPTKRDYSNEIVAEPTTSEAPTNIKSIDPYRELPSE